MTIKLIEIAICIATFISVVAFVWYLLGPGYEEHIRVAFLSGIFGTILACVRQEMIDESR